MKYLRIVFALLSTSILIAQNNATDTIVVNDSVKKLKFNYKQLIIPTALIGYGLIGIESDQIKNFNSEVQEEVTEHIDDKVTIDDFAQYAPAAAVYALNAFGDKGKNNLRDRSIILASSYLMMSVTVLALKSTTKVERPDGSSNNSFPSGHTATAFAGAEFLWQEYKDKSIWYGISGYLVAAGTGAFRIVNNRHWFTDVAAGAGIGILSTKAAYWMYPFLNKKVFTKKEKENKGTTLILPYYNGKELGCNLVIQF
ncbi:phosphatase PAP2 family protein [Flavobacterium granuli]|uniref:Membrane-associated phospholipid phosphatase n=1 Tax=Flavobacterium granuli TaxID=280093 RepID=A0ABU1RZW4_9FLAO|nr:phosphatase PAP2 family protein [Flavobacterium granuli]MDR6844301.1 membrane-associated phospholipid phosphatase [Flavobacterium granuli]